MVVLVNPNNPTGVLLTRDELEEAKRLCEDAGAWLVVDNTYEHFTFEPEQAHVCVSGDRVINIFSFSKAFGMMGWRVGYLAYPNGDPRVGEELAKVQDTIPICPTQISQEVALGALEAGRGWAEERVAGLARNREAVAAAFGRLGAESVWGDSAIYLFGKLPGEYRRPRRREGPRTD